MRVVLASLVLLGLAACSGAEEDAGNQPAAETPVPVEPDGGIGDGAGPPPADAPGMIPARFHGVWDYELGDCVPESDLRIEISGNEILFYESIGIVTGVAAKGDDVIVSLSMEGEGETWDEKMVLRVQDTPERLLLLPQAESEILLRPMPRKRCT